MICRICAAEVPFTRMYHVCPKDPEQKAFLDETYQRLQEHPNPTVRRHASNIAGSLLEEWVKEKNCGR